MTNNADIIRNVYDAFGKGDIPTVLGSMDPNVEWREADGFPYAGTYAGPDAVLQGVFMRLGSEWDGFRAEPDEVLDAGDMVVGLGYYSGRWRGPGLTTGRTRTRSRTWPGGRRWSRSSAACTARCRAPAST